MDFDMDWINLAENKVQWLALVTTTTSLRVKKKDREFLNLQSDIKLFKNALDAISYQLMLSLMLHT
jgi:hypothetical protein